MTPAGKFPGTPEIVGVRVGGAGDAAGFDPGVHGPGEFGVFHDSHRLAGEVRKPLPLAGRLDPAVHHHEDGTGVGRFIHLLEVQAGVETVLQALDQSGNSSPRFDAEARHDPLGLDDGELPPRLAVGVHGRVHAMGSFDGLEPEAVVGQPVFGAVDDDVDQLVLVQVVEEAYPLVEDYAFRGHEAGCATGVGHVSLLW